MRFVPGDILLVPISFTDASGQKRRPALVVYDGGDADVLVAPVTSQAIRSRRDVTVANWQAAGLRLPSIVRVEKLATVDKSTVIRKMGRMPVEDWLKIRAVLTRFFTEITST